MNTEHPVLATEGLTIRFGGHVAVNNVTAEFRPGTLTAIVGPNGAGKTTYFNLISGQLPATSGSVRLYGEDITHLGAAQRTRRGIGRAFQLTNLFPNLTVLENVRLAVQNRAGLGLNLLSLWSDHVEAIEKAEHFLLRVALADRIVVLHNGYLVADGDPAEVMNSPIVQEAYLGMGVAEHV
mgnify:CR=1 FL=1